MIQMLDFGFYNIDCMDGMREFPDKHFDLAIIDPPYGIKQGGDGNHTRSCKAISKQYHTFEDDSSPQKSYFNTLFRISKHQIILGANHFISKIPFDSPSWIVWDKKNGDNDFSDCELAWTSFSTSVRKVGYRWHGMLQGNMKNKEKRIHPTQKPIYLYRWLILTYARSG